VFRSLVLVVRIVPSMSILFDVIPMVREEVVVTQPVVVVQVVDWGGWERREERTVMDLRGGV